MIKRDGTATAAHREQPSLPRVDPRQLLADVERLHAINIERLRTIPSLSAVVVTTKVGERSEISQAFQGALGQLSEEQKALEAVLSTRLSKEHRRQGMVLRRSLTNLESELHDRINRADSLFKVTDGLPSEVAILSRHQSNELLISFGEYRSAYWRGVYRLPFVQEMALKALADVARGDRRVETVVHSSLIKAPPERELLKAVRKCARRVGELRANSGDSPTKETLESIAEILVTLPLGPDILDDALRQAEVKTKRLETLEISLVCAHGKITAKSAKRDPDYKEWMELSRELGGKALYARSLVQDLNRAQAPYLRIKHYVTTANMPYIKKMVSQNPLYKWCRDDLLVDGAMGLMRAIEKFDPLSGMALLTYATSWIQQFTSRGYERNSQSVHIPSNLATTLSRLRRKVDPTRFDGDTELAKKLQVPIKEIALVRPFINGVASLDREIRGGGITVGDRCSDARAPNVVEETQKNMGREVILQALQGLTKVERDVIAQRFGLEGQVPRTLRQIAAEMGLSRTRIQQIERRAVEALREGKSSKVLRTLALETE
jgi:RNA polymerase primary sigma factor